MYSRRAEIQDRSYPNNSRFPLLFTPTDSIPAHSPPVDLVPLIIRSPTLLNRLKSDGL